MTEPPLPTELINPLFDEAMKFLSKDPRWLAARLIHRHAKDAYDGFEELRWHGYPDIETINQRAMAYHHLMMLARVDIVNLWLELTVQDLSEHTRRKLDAVNAQKNA